MPAESVDEPPADEGGALPPEPATDPATDSEPETPVVAVAGDPAGERRTDRHRRAARLLAAVAAFAFLADLVTKIVVVAALEPQQRVPVLGDWLMLTLVRNPGAAFGMATGATVILSVIAAVVSVVIVRTARRIASFGWAVALGLLLGGALGNLVDRIFRAPGPLRGHVVDWIRVPFDFPVFNLADSAVVCGGILAALLAFRGIDLAGHRENAKPRASS